MRYNAHNPRANRARVFGLLERARATQDFEALRAAKAGVATVGPGSRHSPRELFEQTLVSVTKKFVDIAMDDPDTKTVVTFGRDVLATPLLPAGYTTGLRHLMVHGIHEADATGFADERLYNGRAATVKIWEASDGALVAIESEEVAMQIAQFDHGTRVQGGPIPLIVETIAQRPLEGTREVAVRDVDAVGVRLLPYEIRAMLAGLALEITNGENEIGLLGHVKEMTSPSRPMQIVHLPGD